MYYTQNPVKAFTWTIPPLEWIEADMSIKDLKGAVKYLEEMKGLPEIDPHQVELVKRMSVPMYENTDHQISWTITGIAALACGLLVLGVCAKTWCCVPRYNHLPFAGVSFVKDPTEPQDNQELREESGSRAQILTRPH